MTNALGGIEVAGSAGFLVFGVWTGEHAGVTDLSGESGGQVCQPAFSAVAAVVRPSSMLAVKYCSSKNR